MILSSGSYSALFSCVVNRSVSNKINPNTLVANVRRVFRERGLTVSDDASLTYAILTEQSQIGENRFAWECIVRFTGNGDMDSTVIDDWYAYAWNTTIGETDRIPSNNPSRGGALLGSCSRYDTTSQSAGVLSFLNPFSGAMGGVKYYQVCSQYSRVASPAAPGRITVGDSIVDRVLSTPIVASSDPQRVGTPLEGAIDVSATAGDAWNRATRAINETFAGGDGMSTNDLKFFAYSFLGIIGVLTVVKVIKEVKAV